MSARSNSTVSNDFGRAHPTALHDFCHQKQWCFLSGKYQLLAILYKSGIANQEECNLVSSIRVNEQHYTQRI